MSGLEHFTTGEAAKLLNVSRSTVSRKFDERILTGPVNPITGERLIARDSLLGFMKAHGITTDKVSAESRFVLLGLGSPELREPLQRSLSGDARLRVESATLGSDVLIRCSRTPPHLLVVDESLPDIQCRDIVTSLRREAEFKDIPILCLAQVHTAEECAEWGATTAWNASSAGPEETVERAYQMLGVPRAIRTQPASYQHQRRWERIPTNLPASLELYPLRAPRKCFRGTATVRDISRGGAFVSDIHLGEGHIPAEPFRLRMQINQAPLTGWQAHGQIVRLQADGGLSAGLRFVRISRPNLHKIATLETAAA